MDLWQLHIFCKVIECKSFSKAAAAVRLSQPTVSSHIKDLEAHFGCRLIDRLARQAVPTKAGELLHQYAIRLEALRSETETALAEFKGEIKGRLVIGGSTIPGGYLLPQIVGSFIKKYRGVAIALHIGDTEKIIADTVSGILELGIVGARTREKSVCQEKLLEDNMGLIVSGDHSWARRDKISLKELFGEPFVAREEGSGTLKSINKSLGKHNCSVRDFNIVTEMGSTQAVIQSVILGVGVSIISKIAVKQELMNGTLKCLSVETLDLDRFFYVTWNRQRSFSPLCKTFMGYLKQSVCNRSRG
jgi:DNA-binding transcriptional LysR family regulator